MVRVQRIELCSRPWEGRILTTIRYPRIGVWSRCPESNRRPTLYESAALPTELQRHGCILAIITPAGGKTKVDSSVAPEAKNCYYVVGRKTLWTRSEGVITPPCHGGDRRFKSGRVRQEKIPSNDGIFSWPG